MRYIKLFEDFRGWSSDSKWAYYKTNDKKNLNSAFWKWFGNSVVKDDNGDPVIMYHGSDHLDKIDKFNSHRGYNFFTTSKSEAGRYVRKSFTSQPDWEEVNKHIGSFYIKAEKLFDPIQMNDSERKSIYDLFEKRGVEIIDDLRKTSDVVSYAVNEDGCEDNPISLCVYILENMADNFFILEHKIVQEWIRSNGYDSFSTVESGDGFNIAVYNSNQIKSVNAVKFDNNSNNINEYFDQTELEYWALEADLYTKLKETPSSYKELRDSLTGLRRKSLDYFWDIINHNINTHPQLESYSAEQQEYIDIISMDPDKYGKYKPKLKTLGVDFDDIYKDVFYIENASLDNIKTKTDFLNFDNYIKYAKKIFHLRKLSSPNHIDKELTLSEVENIGSKLGFDVVYKKYTGEGNYASHFLGKIAMDKTIDVNTLIHEIGHHFEFVSKYEGLANTITYASSPYFIGKKDEVFAENFMHYFIAPKWLKQNLPEVFQELDQKITPEYKTIIREL